MLPIERFSRLAWPSAISLILHLGVGWSLSLDPVEFLPMRSGPASLTVTLANRDEPDPGPAVTGYPIPVQHSAADNAAPVEAEGTLTQKARLLAAPDLMALEEIPVPFPGSVTLRLLVNSRGTVDRITVVKADPIPKELLDGLLDQFEQARFAPALAGSKSIASTRDLVIRYDTGPTSLLREP